MSASASRAKASPACSADTVPDRMRVPIRNICSWAKMRMRSRKSSYEAAWPSERSGGGRERTFFGQRAKEARMDARVHDRRKRSERVGESWRGAKQERNQGDQIGILSQQQKQPPPAVQPGKERVECDDRRIRVCRAG